MNKFEIYTQILREELKPAMGCTEPIAIAYAASILRNALGSNPQKIELQLSGNIIKNVKSVIVPATGGMHGIEAAVAAGVVSNAPQKQLEVLVGLTNDDIPRIKALIEACSIHISELETDKPFEVKMFGTHNTDSAYVHLADRHTNVVTVNKNDTDLTDDYAIFEVSEEVDNANRGLLTVADIVEYAKVVDLDIVAPLIRRQIDMNIAIASEGIRNDYGASIGKILYKNGNCSVQDKARAFAAAGSDARMSGCELPVVINSGSGNQGLTASLPVIVYAKEIGATKDLLYRALVLSNLVTIHLKTGIGPLSAYCGATSAGCGAGAGIPYLYGGGYREIAHTIVNALAINSGMICDGAKSSCAAKIASAVEAGLLGMQMENHDRQFYGGEGIVEKGVENPIRNIGELARDGMRETDKLIIDMMTKNTCR